MFACQPMAKPTNTAIKKKKKSMRNGNNAKKTRIQIKYECDYAF